MNPIPESYDWWSSLNHAGFLLDEQRLRANFPDGPETPLSAWATEQLRGAYTDFKADPDDTATRTHLLTVLFEQVCGLENANAAAWNRKPDASWTHRSVTGEALRPAHIWEGPHGGRLIVFTTSEKRLGIGHGRRAVARVVEWLRSRTEPIAVLSNGHQVRIIWAGADSSASCESDADLWLVEGAPGPQLTALRLLLAPAALTPIEDKSGRVLSPLLRGILDSRKGQAELSALLGERVRLAVERLIQSHGPFLNRLQNPPSPADTYVAACRIIMRLVFSFFAEGRELLPRSLPIYHQSYSLAGLLADLDRAAGSSRGERLAHRYGAWPRLLALFRLIHDGSEHEALPLLAYGGTLFAPGVQDSPEGISRALFVFENACFDSAHPTMPDGEVWEILRLLTKTTVRVRQGSGWSNITVPVDFSDLSSEYIGILYEGLLDYELRSVSPEEAAVIFLAVGNEPALPLARLEAMDDAALKGLFDTFKKAVNAAAEGEEESEDENSDEDEVETEAAADETPPEPAVAEVEPAEALPAREAAFQRALAWARKAALQAGLVKKTRAKGGAAALEYERNLDTAARGLIRKLVLPGEWYLIRWGGTRKGAGTFYTRPGLSVPTIRRTLEPLVFQRAADGALKPSAPEAILALKICDPACGSGTFPVGALRYLTEALFASVFHHRWLERVLERQADGSQMEIIRPIERQGDAHPLLQRARDEVAFRNALHDEDSLRGFLKRLVVENCLYGVDFDPLAIELARLALWVETMDRRLPFGFLDHKFRCGNGLVGAWLDAFQHYPVMAWQRDGGDGNFKNFVHHFREEAVTRGKKAGTVERTGNVWDHALATHLNKVIGPALRDYIEQTTQPVFALLSAFHEPNQLLDEARDAITGIHACITDPAAQQRAFEEWLASDHYRNLRAALDLWCALWFWPANKLSAAPTPLDFNQPTPEALAITEELRRQLRFFHWELEFPDVFTPRPSINQSSINDQPSSIHQAAGFDAVLGNPPWEIQKPNSKEWFSNVDPLYRTYGKTEALAKQTELFKADRPHLGAAPKASDGQSPSLPRSGGEGRGEEALAAKTRDLADEINSPLSGSLPARASQGEREPGASLVGESPSLPRSGGEGGGTCRAATPGSSGGGTCRAATPDSPGGGTCRAATPDGGTCRAATPDSQREPFHQAGEMNAPLSIEESWLEYNARLKALSNFTKFAAFPFGDPAAHENKAFRFSLSRNAAENDALHARWRPKRARLTGFADPAHPFRHQGSADINTYKLFAEQSLALLRPGGRLGFILPSGIYSDKGSATLRAVLLDQCRWEWCFGFENREGIFDIHRSFKFVALLAEKGGKTAAVRTAFMRRHVEDWSQAETMALDYPRELVDKLSPFSKALVEIRDPRDVALLDRMYSRGVLLGDQSPRGWGLTYAREFDMTNDAKLFPPVPKWEAQGFRPDEYGHWLKGAWRPVGDFGLPISDCGSADLPPHARAATVTQRPGLLLSRDGTQAIRIEEIEDVAVPLYEGRMIGQFDFSQKGWVSGKGRTAVWRDIPWNEKQIEPQFLMGYSAYIKQGLLGPKAPFMPIGSATNSRTGTSSYLSNLPAGNSVAFYQVQDKTAAISSCLLLSAYISSFVYDFALRQRLGGLNLNDFVMSETVLYLRHAARHTEMIHSETAARLMLAAPHFSAEWLTLREENKIGTKALRWAVSEHERLRCLCILEALHANAFGYSLEDFQWLMRDCDHPPDGLRADGLYSKLDPKGFWRVDKERDPELRHTVLAQVAFADLQSQGLDAFLAGPDGDGWQIPETLRLADYGLGHDARAREAQPVASRLGPRFLPWQLEKDPAASWAECEAHAAQLDRLWQHARSLSSSPQDHAGEASPVSETTGKPAKKIAASAGQSELPLS